MARSLDNSPSPGSPRRDAARVAPYLTHELTHHGQVTLVPPQNAGRIRKTKQKGEMSGTRRREREREEPRFNTSVPASARRARTTSARVPRAQPANPQNQLVEVRITRGEYACFDILLGRPLLVLCVHICLCTNLTSLPTRRNVYVLGASDAFLKDAHIDHSQIQTYLNTLHPHFKRRS